ncbi:hypothetical protein CEUSTIGMA_g1230.t1 [Chlamydomonas eustigma]|uniref:Uncharacterized protein n=1 Tax=Chlamydomonas eustigma TaxID=1157962 RepID=A0A250WSV3_9CHLO|nr:hypothetical protein CEUSTIGMA_g1230.t1 [Chlamydomonas eustigma]|eukprot:GAX73779.1 hypothetical protein CEUSTIGMA_g1230.t1 [Chlamydomonas eustigma]
MSFAFKPHQVVEVSASSNPKDVIGAIVNASAPAKSASNPNRWFQFAFFFIIVFGMILWFREEIYTMTTDVQKHPILAGIESLQIHKYLGSQWVFGSEKDADDEIDDAMLEKMEELRANSSAVQFVVASVLNATESVVQSAGNSSKSAFLRSMFRR